MKNIKEKVWIVQYVIDFKKEVNINGILSIYIVNIYFLLLLLYVHSYIQVSYLHDRCRTKKHKKISLIIIRYSNFLSNRHSIYIIGANSYRNCESFYIAVKDRNLVFRCWALSVCTVKSRKSHRRKKLIPTLFKQK